MLHAHDMRDATEFKGQHVLVVGTSYSAEDIASQVRVRRLGLGLGVDVWNFSPSPSPSPSPNPNPHPGPNPDPNPNPNPNPAPAPAPDQVWKYGAASVAISHRTAPIGWDTWPKEIVEVPLLQKVESDIGKGFGAQARGGTATLLG